MFLNCESIYEKVHFLYCEVRIFNKSNKYLQTTLLPDF